MLKHEINLFYDGKKHKYEANLIPNPDNDNEYYSILQFADKPFYAFLQEIINELKLLPDDAFAIVFWPDSEDALLKLTVSPKGGYFTTEYIAK